MKVKFKQRKSTLKIKCVFIDLQGDTPEQLYINALKNEQFDVPFHQLITKQGELVHGRDRSAIAADFLPDFKTTFFLIVDASKKQSMTGAQAESLELAQDFLTQFYNIKQMEFSNGNRHAFRM